MRRAWRASKAGMHKLATACKRIIGFDIIADFAGDYGGLKKCPKGGSDALLVLNA
jgi:hypothetical protein